MSGDPKATSDLLAELAALRCQVARMHDLAERCQGAEQALRAREARDHLLADSAPFGIFTIDVHGQVLEANQKMITALCWPSIDREHTPNAFETPLLLASGMVEALHHCLATNTTLVCDAPLSPAQPTVWRYHLSPLTDRHGNTSGVIAFVEDLSPLRQAEEALKKSEQEYRMLFQATPIALLERDASELKIYLSQLKTEGITDLRTYFQHHPQEVEYCIGLIKTIDYNSAFLQLLEVTDRQEFETAFALANAKEFFRMAADIILSIAEGRLPEEKEQTFFTLKGHKKNVLVHALALAGHEATLGRIVISLVDVTSRKHAEEALRLSARRFRAQAHRDNLTGLYNRRYLYRSLSRLIDTRLAGQRHLSLLFLDLDNFKRIVDTCGHLNGSLAIREVARTIREALQDPAYAVAYAGDEFVVVLPDFDSQQALQKALDIQQRISTRIYLVRQTGGVAIQASCGIATLPDHATDVLSLLSCADQALFAVKRSLKGATSLAGTVITTGAGAVLGH